MTVTSFGAITPSLSSLRPLSSLSLLLFCLCSPDVDFYSSLPSACLILLPHCPPLASLSSRLPFCG